MSKVAAYAPRRVSTRVPSASELRPTNPSVEVTKATVEMKPWIEEALRAGLTEAYKGLGTNDHPAGAAKVKPRIGSMPGYMAELIDKGVMHANAAYRLFYGRK